MRNTNFVKNGDISAVYSTQDTSHYSTDTSAVFTDNYEDNGVQNIIESFHIGSRDCDGKIKITQDPIVDLPGFKFCMLIECLKAQKNIGKTSSFNVQQRFGGNELTLLKKGCDAAQPFTISFYAKSDIPATYSIELFDEDNRRHIATPFSVRNFWERVTLTFPGDTVGTFNQESTRSLDLLIWLHSGSDFRAGSFSTDIWHDEKNQNRVLMGDSILGVSGSWLRLTGLQMEVGDTATPFQHSGADFDQLNDDQYFQLVNSFHNKRMAEQAKTRSKLNSLQKIRDAKAAFHDIIKGLMLWKIWTMLAWRDNLLRYKRTVLGPFWLSANMLVLLAGMGLVFSKVLGVDIKSYLPYLAGGLITWGLILAVTTESCEIFVQQQHVINSLSLPYSLHIFRFISRAFLTFIHNAIVFIPLAIFLDVDVNIKTLLFALGVLIILINGVWLSLLLATFGSRFRDISPILTSILQLMFFLTPIIWNRSLITGNSIWVDFNPIFHLVEVIRAPLLGQLPSFTSYAWTLSLAVIGSLVSFYCFSRFRRSIAYWL